MLILTTFARGILPPAGKSHPPNSNQRPSPLLHELFGSSTTRRAAARIPLKFIPASKVQDLGLAMPRHPSRIPDYFGNSSFRRPASDVGERKESKSTGFPRAVISKSKINIKKSNFWRPPTADSVRRLVQSSFEAVSRARTLRKLAQIEWITKSRYVPSLIYPPDLKSDQRLISAQFNSMFKISNFTQNSRLGGNSRHKQHRTY
ncbi:hypothetical protein R3P38DRAFT_2793860 [Favolaschia claudopus]|uniref:Uncharacterized protein n=1 Tax=Favolaschia claudopus TaxID=2862362 RepID=A0AAW0AAR9_9AGAR